MGLLPTLELLLALRPSTILLHKVVLEGNYFPGLISAATSNTPLSFVASLPEFLPLID